jgi:phosphoserine phosphatase RsbU/P
MSALTVRHDFDSRLGDQIELLAAIGWDFAAAAADVGQTLHNAIQRILEHLNAEAGSIFLLNERTGLLECEACAGPLDITGLKLAIDHGIVGRTISTNCLQMVRDVLLDRTFTGAVDLKTGFVTRSILCAPLQIKGAQLGAIEVINKKSADGLFSAADANLLRALAAMVALAIHNARMAVALVGQERMKKELELAGEIQRSLLPRPRAADFPIHGLNLAAFEMSGDFYHFFELGDGRINFCLGDVSGKGMNASLLMAKTISLFNCLAKTMHQPGLLLGAINDELVETAINGMFVTMVAGIYDPLRQRAVFANAGHQPPLYRGRDGEFIEFEALEPPLGIMAGVTYSEQVLPLDGGSLYIFTDGLTEARRQDGSEVGNAGVKTLIERHVGLPPPNRLESLVACLQESGAVLRDDLTILVVGA